MGKRIIAQRRGKGSFTYKAPSHRYKHDTRHVRTAEKPVEGVLEKIVHEPGRNAPVGVIRLDDGSKAYTPLWEGASTGSRVAYGAEIEVREGSTMALASIPEGMPVFNVELTPGDSGRLVRSGGAAAVVMSHDADKTIIRLPSKALKPLDPKCRATVGIAAGGGRKAKPIGKAGKNWKVMHARGRLYPRTSAGAMNAVDHKFGGSNLGVAKTSSRHAPPGAKVGSVGARRTGKKR